jgi:hypothetical protein
MAKRDKGGPEPNAFIGDKPVRLDFAQSVDDLVVKCGGCGEFMKFRAGEVVCSCGNRDDAADLWHEVSIVGPLKGYEVTIYPEDVGMAK